MASHYEIKALVRLPQSLIRIIGHPKINEIRFHLYPVSSPNRPEWRNAPKEVYKKIMGTILETLSLNQGQDYEIGEHFSPGRSETIIDYSILHNGFLLTRLHQQRVPISISPYAAMDFSPLLSDLKLHPREILRCFKRSLVLKKYANIKKVYSLKDNFNPRNETYLPWFWKSETLDFEFTVKQINTVASGLRSQSEYLDDFLAANNPLLLLVTDYANTNTLEKYIEQKLMSNKKLLFWIEENKPEIFIKQHPLLGLIKPTMHKILGREINIIKTQFDLFIPAEILLWSRRDAIVGAEIGSSIFSVESKRLFRLNQDNETELLRQHHLIAARRLKYDVKFPWSKTES